MQENGVDMAIQCIYRDLEYAKSLVKAKAGKNATRTDADDEDEPEESWTFVGDDVDHMRQSVILSPDAKDGPLRVGTGGSSGKALGSRVLGTGLREVASA